MNIKYLSYLIFLLGIFSCNIPKGKICQNGYEYAQTDSFLKQHRGLLIATSLEGLSCPLYLSGEPPKKHNRHRSFPSFRDRLSFSHNT